MNKIYNGGMFLSVYTLHCYATRQQKLIFSFFLPV